MAQALTDKQVVEYIQSASAEGKSQNQIATELAARGVTREQAARIQKQYGYQQTDDQEAKAITKNRMRYATEDQEAVAEQQDDMAGNMQSNKGKKFENRYNKPQTTDRKLGQFDGFNKEPRSFSERGFEEDVVFYDENTILYQDEEYRKVETKPIFGRNIFNTRNLTFSPNQNIATPANHKLGPGDEVIIDIWGANQTSISQTISPDGYINIDNLGLIYLNNMTVTEAEKYLRKRLAAIYSSVDEQSSASQIKLTLGQIRTIQVHVMGEVVNPGTFSLSAFSTAFYALYHAGGVSELGSLRQISVLRKGKEVAKVDVYDFILSGNSAGDISLQDGDMIVVPTYHSLVEVTGSVKRPMFYELTDGESVNTLINYAGNFTGDAYRKSVTVTRKNGREYQIHTVDEENYPTFTLVDGDQIEVGQMLDRFENRLKIRGAVYRAGVYQLNDKINSVKTLVEKAEGIMDDAFLARAVLQRERPDLTLEIIPVDLSGILNGTVADIALQKNDELYIPSIHDLKDIGTIEVM